MSGWPLWVVAGAVTAIWLGWFVFSGLPECRDAGFSLTYCAMSLG